MAKHYTMVDKTGRIGATSADFHLGEGERLVDFPADFDFTKQYEWRVVQGVLTHDPLPAPAAEVDPMDDITAMTVDHEYRLILMEMGVKQ